ASTTARRGSPPRAPTASSRRPPTARPSRPAVWGCATATPTASPRPPPRSTARWPPPAGWWRSSRTTSRPTAPWWCPRRCGRSWARTWSNRRAERCPDSGPEQHHDAARAGARAAFRVDHLDLHHGGRPPGVLDLRPDRGRGAVRAESADVADGQVEGVEAHALLDDRRGRVPERRVHPAGDDPAVAGARVVERPLGGRRGHDDQPLLGGRRPQTERVRGGGQGPLAGDHRLQRRQARARGVVAAVGGRLGPGVRAGPGVGVDRVGGGVGVHAVEPTGSGGRSRPGTATLGGVELLYTGIIGVARTLFKVQGLDITVRGERHFPAVGGAVVVINHTGYFDFVYAGLPARVHKRFIRYMAKAEVFDHPVAGPIMRELKHIPVDRTAGRGSFEEAVNRLRAGELVGVFPEATISRSFEIKGFKSGAVRMAAEAGVPILPVTIWGSQRVWTKGLPKNMVRPGVPILMEVGEPVQATGPVDACTEDLRSRMQATLERLQDEYARRHLGVPGGVDQGGAEDQGAPRGPDPRGGRRARAGHGAGGRVPRGPPFPHAGHPRAGGGRVRPPLRPLPRGRHLGAGPARRLRAHPRGGHGARRRGARGADAPQGAPGPVTARRPGLVATDVDGTLIDDHERVPDANRAVVADLVADGSTF